MDMTMSNYVWTYDQFKVVFTEDTPPPGAVIKVAYTGLQWSGDDCHPGSIGYDLFGKAFNDYLRKVI